MNGLPCQDAELKAEKYGGGTLKKCLKNRGAKNTQINMVIQLSPEEIVGKLTTQK
jgi:hypothetical protein